MKQFLIVAIVAIAVTSARRERPCGGGRNIESCVCADEEETEVSKPWQCRRVQARPESCSCVDGSEWTPTGPCEDESFDIEFCECDDGTEVNEPRECKELQAKPVSCTCSDGSVFEPRG